LSDGTQIYHTFRSHFEAVGARRVLRGWFHTEDPQILGAPVQNLVTQVTWHLGFLYPC